MTLPLDYTFCVSESCPQKHDCARADIPNTDRPLSMADFDPNKDRSTDSWWSICTHRIEKGKQ